MDNMLLILWVVVHGRSWFVNEMSGECDDGKLNDVKYDPDLIAPQRDFVSDARKLEAITVLRCQ